MGLTARTTGGCPPAVKKRFPNAGVSALLAARTSPVGGAKAISSTRVVPPVEIACWKLGAAGLVALKTLSVLSPSPAYRVVTPPEVTVKTPSGPETDVVACCPVNPPGGVGEIARPRNVRLDPKRYRHWHWTGPR